MSRRDVNGSANVEAFVQLIEKRAPRPLAIQEMARLLDMDHYDRKAIRRLLEAEVTNGKLRRIGKTRYQWIRDFERTARAGEKQTSAGSRHPGTSRGGGMRVEGHYSRARGGFGFVEVLGRAAERFARDILVPAGMEGEALHGDRVEVEVVRRDPRLRRTVGRIVAVTGPVHDHVVGTLNRERYGWVLVPENELLPAIELIGDPFPKRDQAGLVARVRLTRRATAQRGPGAVLEEVLGTADDPEVQFLIITNEHGLRVDFPPAVLSEAERLPEDPSPEDYSGRADLRSLPFVTIDGETARDFDDAVCLETQPNGGRRLWVAIADVSHYVTPGSALDFEAAQRGTSVYFPDRAVPMLPPQLSNTLCSLNPRRDRLVLVAEMEYDGRGQRHASRFHRGVICSKARLTYTKVAAVLSQTDTTEIRAWRTELEPLLPQLRQMQAFMRVLYRNRVEAGSLDLDLPEALIDLSEEGRSVGIRLLQRNDAHRLIEEFMLEANRAVAMHLREKQLPFPYRIHEAPDPDDVDELNRFLGAFGIAVRYDQRVRPRDVQGALDQLEGHRLARVLSRQVLRSLKQAQYSTLNVGHFGLAFPIYCHFTSPIRRYPDLLVHRQLNRLFDGNAEQAREEAEALEAASVQSSQCEREAMQAERDMLDLKKCEFMLGHLLEPELGTIVSVANFGFFVELDAYPIEGLVRAEDLTDDRYYLIEEERALKGMRTNRRFRIGDRVRVEISNVDLRSRQIDLALLERLTDGTEENDRKRNTIRVRKPKKVRRSGERSGNSKTPTRRRR
ncbi:MAG TPA: ribonuclease R [Candidatus Acidoferrales bacterium]|nr:ribonuclease R [Candidatus Acidoferrales bacterium]